MALRNPRVCKPSFAELLDQAADHDTVASAQSHLAVMVRTFQEQHPPGCRSLARAERIVRKRIFNYMNARFLPGNARRVLAVYGIDVDGASILEIATQTFEPDPTIDVATESATLERELALLDNLTKP